MTRVFNAAFAFFGILMGVSLIGLIISPTSAAAEDMTVIGSSGKWTAYSLTEDGNRVCYMVSSPTSEKGNYTRRGKVFALVTHRPAAKSFDVVSIMAGYSYRKNSEADVQIGSKRFKLYTWGDRAWSYNEDDAKIVQAMIRGNNMTVKGYSERGTLTTDVYSLSGFTAARKMINQACNHK